MDNHPKGPIASWKIAVITIAAFFVIDTFNGPIYRALAAGMSGDTRLGIFALIIYGSTMGGPLLIAWLLFGRRQVSSALGLDHNPLPGLGFALAATAPMLVYFALSTPLAPPERPVVALLQSSLLPGLGEELFFRAFLFGFLYRYAGWGFLPAALLVAATFGVGHLYQGNTFAESLAVFGITATGGLWFSWLYAEWDFNVWVPAGFHILMNAYWEVFSVSDSAVGPMGSNAIRLVVILLSIAATIVIARRAGRSLRVRGRGWLLQTR